VPPRYSIEVRPAASKMLPKLDPPVSRRVLAAIHRLADDPRPAGVKALVGSPGLLRLRVGDYRVV
jgi:mRNA interferase RelE/StbE